MNTLLREIQILLERTYGSTGLDLEQFLLSARRNQELATLAEPTLREATDLGRVFLRIEDAQLHMGIYFDPWVVETLESENPQHGLTETNVHAFTVFLEEIDHAIHAALLYREGTRDVMSEDFVRALEIQAKVDTYLVLQIFYAFFNPGRKLRPADRRWLKACVFDSQDFSSTEPLLRLRYHETNRLARRYVRHLDLLPPRQRTAELRRFRTLTYQNKRSHIQRLRETAPLHCTA